jgi:hypothetical protein
MGQRRMGGLSSLLGLSVKPKKGFGDEVNAFRCITLHLCRSQTEIKLAHEPLNEETGAPDEVANRLAEQNGSKSDKLIPRRAMTFGHCASRYGLEACNSGTN